MTPAVKQITVDLHRAGVRRQWTDARGRFHDEEVISFVVDDKPVTRGLCRITFERATGIKIPPGGGVRLHVEVRDAA